MADLFELCGKFVFDNTKGLSEMKNTTSEGQKLESKFSNTMKKIGVAITGAFAVSKMKEFGQACIEANSVQQQAELKLETVMKQRMNASDSTIQSIKELASAQQNLGVVGDEVQLSGAQQLSTFLNTDSALKSLIPAMNDLAVQQNGCNVTSENMVSIGNMMGKVMQGQTSALSRVGISFTEAQEKVLKYGTEEEKAATLAEVITDNVGHMNAEFAKTDDGKIQQAKNTLGDLQETIGAKLVPIQAKFYQAFAKVGTWVVNTGLPVFEKFADTLESYLKPAFENLKTIAGNVKDDFNTYLKPALDNLKDAFIHVKDACQPMIDKFTEYVTSGQGATDSSNLLKDAFQLLADAVNVVADVITKVSDWCSEHQKTVQVMTTLIASFAAAFFLVNGVISIWTTVSTIATVTTTAFGGAVALLTSPIIIVVAAIGALIAVGVLLYKNWDKIKGTAGKLKAGLEEKWNGIKKKTSEVFNNVKETMSNAMGKAHDYVKGKLDKIKSAYDENGGGLKGIASATMEGVKQHYSVGYDAINTLTGGRLGDAVSKAKEKMGDMKEKISSKLSDIKENFGSKLSDVKGSVGEKFGNIASKIGEKMSEARENVRAAIDKIKGFFNFTWSLPKLKLPHFSTSGKFSLNPPSVPKFSIDWYAKAMDNPLIMNKPTAFGMNANGQIMVGGEAGSEVVSGTDTLMNMISQASGGEQVVDILNRMFMFLQEYVPQFANMQLVTDTGVLAGEIAPQIDTELGRIKSLKGRGN